MGMRLGIAGIYGIILVSCPDHFFLLSFYVGVEKKGLVNLPIEFLCSQIHNFWGSLMNSKDLLMKR